MFQKSDELHSILAKLGMEYVLSYAQGRTAVLKTRSELYLRKDCLW